MSEEVRLRQELLDLDRRREQLDRTIAAALQRQRFSHVPEDIRNAEAEERTLLVELDRLMTRIRAVEGKLLQIRKQSRS